MRGLDRLLRLHEWRLEEQRQKLTELERLVVSLRAQIVRLEQDVAPANGVSLPDRDTDLSGGRRIDAVSRLERLRRSLSELEDEMVRAAQDLAAAEKDVKNLGLVRARNEARSTGQRKRDRKDASEAAETGGSRQARRT